MLLGFRRRVPLELEADEQHPDRGRRAEHAEDDPCCHQICASQSVQDQPQATGEDQPGAQLAEENRAKRSRETPCRERVARKVASVDRVM